MSCTLQYIMRKVALPQDCLSEARFPKISSILRESTKGGEGGNFHVHIICPHYVEKCLFNKDVLIHTVEATKSDSCGIVH